MSGLLKLLIPDVYLENINAIDSKKLKEKKNIKGIILDLDNTIIPKGTRYLDEQIVRWIEEAKRNGIKICLVSNTHTDFSEIISKLDIPFFFSRYKPMKKPFLTAMETMNTDSDETAVIGDQIFTDVWGGNRLKLLTILVRPLSRRDSLGTVIFNRTFEKLLFSLWLKKGKIKLKEGKWPE